MKKFKNLDKKINVGHKGGKTLNFNLVCFCVLQAKSS